MKNKYFKSENVSIFITYQHNDCDIKSTHEYYSIYENTIVYYTFKIKVV